MWKVFHIDCYPPSAGDIETVCIPISAYQRNLQPASRSPHKITPSAHWRSPPSNASVFHVSLLLSLYLATRILRDVTGKSVHVQGKLLWLVLLRLFIVLGVLVAEDFTSKILVSVRFPNERLNSNSDREVESETVSRFEIELHRIP